MATNNKDRVGLKVVIIGDCSTGKSHLVQSLFGVSFEEIVRSEEIETYNHKLSLDSFDVELEIIDIPGQEDFDEMKKTIYPDTDVFMLCYSAVHSDSLENLGSQWLAEIQEIVEKPNFIFVGNKMDLKEKYDSRVDLEKATEFCKELGGFEAIECSALLSTNVTEAFSLAVDCALKKKGVTKLMEKDKSETIGIKLVLVGDGAVGTTALLKVFLGMEFPGDYKPTVIEHYSSTFAADPLDVELKIVDTAGQEEFDEVRKLIYTDTDVFMICYSTINWKSLHNIKSVWLPEIKEVIEDPKFVLVGTKTDLIAKVLEREEIERKKSFSERYFTNNNVDLLYTPSFCKKIGGFGTIECSALENTNVKAAFELAIQCAMQAKNVAKSKKTACILL